MIRISRRGLLPLVAGLPVLRSMLQPGSAMAEDQAFPADFVWGASTSSYQIEGAVNEDGRGQSIWDVFSHTPGKVKNGDTGDVACDHYHRWREDVELLERGGFNAYRFSTAWPRILPAGTGAIEPRGLDFYDRLVDALIARGIAPWLCLYHWDLPQALQDAGRLAQARHRGEVRRLRARRGAAPRRPREALGDVQRAQRARAVRLRHRRPCAGLTGCRICWPRSITRIWRRARVRRCAPSARSASRHRRQSQPVRPSSDEAEDRRAAERFDAFGTARFSIRCSRAPIRRAVAGDIAPIDRATTILQIIRQPVDFFGLIIMRRCTWPSAASLFGAWFGAVPPGTRFTAIGWPIEPAGLTETLIRLRDGYGDPEIYVTENGACYDDQLAADGAVHDDDRIAYLREHIAAARARLPHGVNLRGYFVWSLLDNFEWAEGYSRRFGIIHVDFATQKRTPKASFAFLAETIRRGG